MRRTLVVTNDFPPSRGDIESFVRTLVGMLPPDEVVVYTSSRPGGAAYDATVPFPVLRDPARTLLPTAKVTAGVLDAFRAYGCDRVLFGAAAPMGMLAPALRDAGAERLVGLTHRADCWWSRVPGTRQMLRRIGDTTDVLTYLGNSTRSVIAPALSPAAAGRMQQLTPGVDTAAFRPGTGGSEIRRRYGIAPGDPVVVSVGELTARAGQGTLIRSFRRVLAELPSARLLVVGGGPEGSRLAGLAASMGVAERVVLTGPVPRIETPSYFDAGHVFASMPRAGFGGLEPAPFGIEVLQAQAAALPVVVGESGGVTELVRPGDTGYGVDPGDPGSLTRRLVELLRDRELASAMGRAGRSWVERTWTWDHVGARLNLLLDR